MGLSNTAVRRIFLYGNARSGPRMTYPVAHGHTGFATSHRCSASSYFDRTSWNKTMAVQDTSVAAEKIDQLYRSRHQYNPGLGHSLWGASYRLPLVQYQHTAIELCRDWLDFCWRINGALLRAATPV